DDLKFDDDEVTIARPVPQFPGAAPPNAPNTRPPPPVDKNAYPEIPGAVNVPPPAPGRPVVTAPLVPQQARPLPVDRNTGRMIATPPPTPAIMSEFSSGDISGSVPQPMPRGFPDHSPEPIALQQMVPPHAMPPPSPTFETPAPQKTPLRTQVGM